MTKTHDLANAAALLDVTQAPLQVNDDDLYDIGFLCRWFGGTGKPLHPATIYRGIARGDISRPLRTAPNTNCWLGKTIKDDRQKMIDAERTPLPSPKHRASAHEAA